MKEAIAAIFRCARAGQPATLAVLSQMISEPALTELSRLVAQYHDVAPTEQDVEMYLDRIAQSAPKSGSAAHMSDQELEQYLQSLRERKLGAAREGEDEDT
jgi:DNA primase